jgi:hypothetical protein
VANGPLNRSPILEAALVQVEYRGQTVLVLVVVLVARVRAEALVPLWAEPA